MDTLNKPAPGEMDFEHIFNISPDLIFILDRDHNIIRANRALMDRAGVSPGELAGSKCFQCIHRKDGKPGFCAHEEFFQDGQEHTTEMFLENFNGWFSVTVTPLRNGEGNITGSIHVARDITERRQTEEALKNSLALLEAALESIHNGILVVSLQGNVIRTNAIFAELWDIPRDILAMADDNKLLSYVRNQLVDPDKFIDKVLELYGTPEAESLDLIYLKDGRVFERISKPLYLGNAPQGRVWSFLDITERKRSEEALIHEQDLMAALMDNIPDHIYFKDLESRFFRNNRAHLLSFGLHDADLLNGKSDFDFFVHEVAQRQYEDEQEIIRTGQSLNKEEFTIRNDNSVNWYYSTKMPLRNKDGNIIGTFGISRDITRRKVAEEELTRKNEQLRTVNAEKDKFFSIIAHDIRSPFNTFLGFTHIMAEELPSMRLDEIQKIALTMRTSATNLYRLLENLLEWSLLQRGVTSFEPATYLLMPEISENMVFAVESAKKKEIEFKFDVPENLMVFADKNMLGGILRNLSSNAVKFTPIGGKITIAATSGYNNSVEISVRDTGIGMNKEMTENLFRIDANSNRKGTEGELSTGLGLIICRDFIDKHNGRICVESQEGKGTIFRITFPGQPGRNAL